MTRLEMRALLAAGPVRLAPMASLTNVPFRQAAARCGSGFTTHEEIDAEALLRGRAHEYMAAAEDRSSGVAALQLLGNSAETLVPAALMLVEAGADIIDINMGCPVQKIVKTGRGAALMRDVSATAKILEALRAALDVPLTIKIRGGWDESQPNAVEVARMAEDVGVDAITVHPRTRAQQFGGKAPWQVIREVVEAVSLPITGNGDVTSLAEARRMMEETGCAAVMIGRGALGKPWIFDPAYERLEPDAQIEYELNVVRGHMTAIDEHFDARLALVQTKKHLSLYLGGRPDAKALRAAVFASKTVEEARGLYEQQIASRYAYSAVRALEV